MCIKTCSFFGHRKVDVTEKLKQQVKEIIEDLVINKGVLTFLFGSKSDFNHLCLLAVSELKVKYPNIKRIAYTCKSESCTLESEREKLNKIYSKFKIQNVPLCVEEEFEHKTKYTSGRASYIERNQAMINNSDYCIFYYDEEYKPPLQKYYKRSLDKYQPKSGTALAFKYAKQKKKTIINIAPFYLH